MISDKLKQQIKMHALCNKPKECCGFIVLNDNNEQEILKCDNIADEPTHYVKISPRDYLFAKSIGNIVYFYHSHKDKARMSEFDKIQQQFNGLNYLIYNIETDEFIEVDKNQKYNKYFNLDFELGVQDCFTLIQNFYKNELKIFVNNFLPDRKDNWWKTEDNYILKYLKDSPFYITVESPVNNDLIILDYGDKRWHFGIYLDGFILHHPRGSKSLLEEYNQKYKSLTKYVLRVRP